MRPLSIVLRTLGATGASLVVIVAGTVLSARLRAEPEPPCPAPRGGCWVLPRSVADSTAPNGLRLVNDVVLVHVAPPPGALAQMRSVAPPSARVVATRWAPAGAPPATYPTDLPFVAGREAQTVEGVGPGGVGREARWTFTAPAARDSAFVQLAAATEKAGWRGIHAFLHRAPFEPTQQYYWGAYYGRAGRKRTLFAGYAGELRRQGGREFYARWWNVQVTDWPERPSDEDRDAPAPNWMWPPAWRPAPTVPPPGSGASAGSG